MCYKTSKRILAIAISAVMAGSCVWGAISGGTESRAAKKAAVSPKSVTLKVGEKKTIKITGKKKGAKYTFKASNNKISVTSKGKITAKKAGKATVTVKQKYKGKNTKIGTVKVTVKAKAAANNGSNSTTAPNTTVPTLVPGAQTSSAPVTQPTEVPGTPSTTAPGTQSTATPVEKPTLQPAYEERTIDFEGSTAKEVDSELVVELGTEMIYGGVCKVAAEFTQETGSEMEISAGVTGQYLYFEQNGAYINKNTMEDRPLEDLDGVSSSFSCPSGEKTQKEFSFTVPKYTKDFNLKFSAAGKFKVENVSIRTMPYEGADYAEMVEKSTRSTGNNARIKKAIEKARAGEDVTLAYLGGSITEGFAASETNNGDCYAETSYKQFRHLFGAGDGSNVHFINAGMSGTSSVLGITRYQRDVLDQMKVGEYPDILFIDFAVNDGNDDDTYESLIRTALDQGSAVVLMFVVFQGGNGRETVYSQYGEYYDLAMVSPGSGMPARTDAENKELFDKWCFWIEGDKPTDYGHPDVSGHRYMADCITRMFTEIDDQTAQEDNIKDIRDIEPKKSDNFVGMKTLVSSTDISGIESVKEVQPGSFSTLTDSAQPKLQYIKNGKENLEWFPDVWMHAAGAGDESFTATINCRSLIIAYKESASCGEAECFIDGKSVGKLDQTGGGWNNARLLRALQGDTVAEHTIEIKMLDSSKPATIYAIGYCDTEK